MRIFKYEVRPGEGWVQMPVGAEVLHVAAQAAKAFVWAKVDTRAGTEPREIVGRMTGEEFPAGATYLGAAHTCDGAIVVHVLELPRPEVVS